MCVCLHKVEIQDVSVFCQDPNFSIKVPVDPVGSTGGGEEGVGGGEASALRGSEGGQEAGASRMGRILR